MSTEKDNTRNQFNDKSPDGYAKTVEGHLSAENNPEFVKNYEKLLSKNDRIFALDNHDDRAGLRWLASDKHLSMMKSADYPYLLLEFAHQINPHIAAYEEGLIKYRDLKTLFIDEVYELSPYSSPDIEPYINVKAMKKEIGTTCEIYLDGIKRAKTHGIKIRYFDRLETEDKNEADENTNTEYSRFHVDSTWVPYIENITKGEKAVFSVGGGHVYSSHGIDEYMEKLGYKTATCLIKNEQDALPENITPAKNYKDSSFTINDFVEKFVSSDTDGYDQADFSPDLFYNEQTKELIDATTYEQKYVIPTLEKFGIPLSDPLSKP